MDRDQFIKALEETFDECIEIVKKKNADYSSHSDPFRNFRNSEIAGVTVERGILCRVMDKISRLSNLLDQEAQVKGESIFDNCNDIINYINILKQFIKSNGKKMP